MRSPTRNVTPWVRIAPDGKITILTAGAEMGQGSMTSLPLIVAEEMDADWSKVAIEWAPADPSVYGYKNPLGNDQLMWIVGSRAVQLYFTQLRTAGAQVRKVLIAERRAEMGRRRRHAQDRAERGDQSRERGTAQLWRDRRVRDDSRDAAGGRSKGAQAAGGFPPDRQDRAAPRHARPRSTAPRSTPST